MILGQIQNVVQNALFRSSLRFAITIVVVDVIVHFVYGSTPAALLGSFAVAIHLYFLDFDGDVRERFAGHGIATLVGAAAVVIGVLCAQPLWLAVTAALVVSSLFAYARVLRGYVARSAVGLQGAFFLPLMIPATMADMPSLLGGWLIGSGVSIIAALALLPHYRTGVVRRALAEWLKAAANVAGAAASRQPLAPAIDELLQCRNALISQVTGSYTRPGAVGRSQRALASMVAGARWSMPVAHKILPLHTSDGSTLAAESQAAYLVAADLVLGEKVDQQLPNVPQQRLSDLESLADQPVEVVKAHYPVRLLSISAMAQLYRAAQSRGKIAPTPDVGSMPDENPLAILRANLRWNSLWLHNALRTGLGTAVSVLIVRVVGLEHGVWVILAALSVTQVTFTATSGTKAMFKIVGGAIAGVVLAGVIIVFHLPYVVFLIALPFFAFVAKQMQSKDMFFAQMTYTPFALINLSVLVWPPHKGIEFLRVEDILLGASVAAVFTLLIFPMGINRLVAGLQAQAISTSRSYLQSALSRLRGGKEISATNRSASMNAIRAYEDALDAAFMSARVDSDALEEHENAAALARDYLIGGDTCVELLDMGTKNPKLLPVGQELSTWWQEFLSQKKPVSLQQG